MVMPFIRAFGYDVFNPKELVPEFTADVGTKKGEKVDYAVKAEEQPVMLFESKRAGGDLSVDHASQLFRYFHVTDAQIGVLTNGIVYHLFTDLEESNKMDERPFLEFNLLDYDGQQVNELKKLRKESFDLEEMLSTAHDLKYRKALKKYLEEQWSEPEEEFVRFMTSKVYDGRITKRVRDQFQGIVRQALQQFVSEKVSGRLKSALMEEAMASEPAPSDGGEELPEGVVDIDEDGEVITTKEEMEGFRVVRAIMREVVDVDRVAPRDVKTYFGVLLDDNNRQPICRLHLNTSQWYLGVFDADKNEERIPIDTVDEMYDHADKLRRTAEFHD